MQAKSETLPAVVRLGLLAAPGWWLSALRQAVCARAHWQLHGSRVHAVPDTPQNDRPPQVCYGKIFPLYRLIKQSGKIQR